MPLTLENWRGSNRRKLAQRALQRQLAYQVRKAKDLSGHEHEVLQAMGKASRRVRDLLESFQPIDGDARVIEVGSGSHGLIFTFGTRYGVGVDPLAVSYAKLFPCWQANVPTVAAFGEHLPFLDHSFGIVLCDNVVDHAESPSEIAAELVRILTPGGLLYFTVNVHHALYAVAAGVHSTWRAMSVPFEIGPFADHTTHLTVSAARRLFVNLPIQILGETCNIAGAKARARKRPSRHLGDTLKKMFFKNAVYELVARRV
ncbi:MAG: hypothetical protein C5B55_11725 [Blastocatellia bacterium]|nr:MAG: hypothetical protein C5B55_11725 [Blastocatellia bacterium]